MIATFAERTGLEVVLFTPSDRPRTLDAPSDVPMTWGRALVLQLLRSYAAKRRSLELRDGPDGASHLEIQKLMYFANQVEPALGLKFAPARYGPYSETIRHLLQDMEGAFTTGLGDGTARTLDNNPISLTADGSRALNEFPASERGARVTEACDAVLRIVEGFEGPYGVELLASAHWVVTNQDAHEKRAAAEAVRGWTERKGRIFTDAHVEAALEQLAERIMPRA
ncbi:Panacea domain-containing protein [Nocardia puris]|uniref:hypothetical protein n=1 Tax=Nocardia puris TaxID=208602 RepID=UPI000831C3D3|nr:hypothetical protein [Nocardia puris]